MENKPVLQVTDLVCGYADRALFKPLSFTVYPKQAMQILGSNGRGKSTLLKVLAGLSQALGGAWQWGMNEPKEQLCFITHANALNLELTPVENLAFLLRLHKTPSDVFAISKTLAALGLKHIAHKPCRKLSAGQKRRVALARLWFSMDKKVWLLDEPAAALDVDARAVLCAKIAEFVNQGGAVIYTTHGTLELTDIVHRQVEPVPC